MPETYETDESELRRREETVATALAVLEAVERRRRRNWPFVALWALLLALWVATLWYTNQRLDTLDVYWNTFSRQFDQMKQDLEEEP